MYWDQRTWLEHRNPRIRELVKRVYDQYGYIDRQFPLMGTKNEPIFTRIVDAQIAQLYGVRLRSTPSYFIQDDHDYFENDEADERWITFPPDPYMMRLARTTQHLYYPEFLLDANQPSGLAGASAEDRRPGLSESYGAIRYGTLLEVLLYDIRRYLTLKGPLAAFVDPDAEKWLIARTQADGETDHLIHCPSHPFGWSAGKWGEWYPDLLQSGPLGTGDLGFPSAFRDTPPKVPTQLAVEEMLKPLEKNGFTIIDVTPQIIQFRLFAWRPPQPMEQIDTMEPILAFELKR